MKSRPPSDREVAIIRAVVDPIVVDHVNAELVVLFAFAEHLALCEGFTLAHLTGLARRYMDAEKGLRMAAIALGQADNVVASNAAREGLFVARVAIGELFAGVA